MKLTFFARVLESRPSLQRTADLLQHTWNKNPNEQFLKKNKCGLFWAVRPKLRQVQGDSLNPLVIVAHYSNLIVISVSRGMRAKCGWADIYLRGDCRLTDHVWERQTTCRASHKSMVALSAPVTANSAWISTNFPLKVNWFECYRFVCYQTYFCCVINNLCN